MTIQQAPYLRQQRKFPFDRIDNLSQEVDLAYIDIAAKLNARTIGIYAIDFPMVTGEQWFLTGQPNKQQTLRQVYTFSSGSSIIHGIDLDTVVYFTTIKGTFTDGSIWYPLPYVDVVSSTNQVNIVVDSTNIIITAGGGAPPIITDGIVILEWLSEA